MLVGPRSTAAPESPDEAPDVAPPELAAVVVDAEGLPSLHAWRSSDARQIDIVESRVNRMGGLLSRAMRRDKGWFVPPQSAGGAIRSRDREPSLATYRRRWRRPRTSRARPSLRSSSTRTWR